ncbi:MAG: Co2+/Mg2+ efflux protein ApaG [Rhodospirillales bacterium]|nr:Co2+/Mg2+ efflux protein ApaG [Rhodospirillales bacterium]
MYEQTTRGVSISVNPEYLEDQSEPANGRFTWAYHVQIENVGNQSVQILIRHWKITNIKGESHEVVGDGLVGQQPVLQPGDVFEYTSGTPLSTPSGFMSGSFHVVAEGGDVFDAVVPAFSLDSPQQRRALH